MATYYRTAEDCAYRRVSLRTTKTPDYVEFPEGSQAINYPDQDFVLEVLHQDGTSELIYDKGITGVQYALRRPNTIVLSNCPTERLWVKKSGGGRTLYKVPSDLPSDGINYFIFIPQRVDSVELFGDKYFSAVYELLPQK